MIACALPCYLHIRLLRARNRMPYFGLESIHQSHVKYGPLYLHLFWYTSPFSSFFNMLFQAMKFLQQRLNIFLRLLQFEHLLGWRNFMTVVMNELYKKNGCLTYTHTHDIFAVKLAKKFLLYLWTLTTSMIISSLCM